MSLLEVRNIGKQLGQGHSLDRVCLTLEAHQKVVLAGENGSGKTTLARIIAGLTEPDEGEVLFEGRKVRGPLYRLIPGEPGIAYLSQHFELRKNYRVADELEAYTKVDPDRADRILGGCQVRPLLDRMTGALSGGERQRIALARALLTDPRLLILDEPYSNLDAQRKEHLKTLIEKLRIELGFTCLQVLHEASDSLSWADRIIVLEQGRVIQQGTPEQLYWQPVNTYCAGLFGSFNRLTDPALTSRLPVDRDPSGLWVTRPSGLFLTAPDKGDSSGIVRTVRFWGAYYTVVVRTAVQDLEVLADEGQCIPGQKVGLELDPQKAWHCSG